LTEIASLRLILSARPEGVRSKDAMTAIQEAALVCLWSDADAVLVHSTIHCCSESPAGLVHSEAHHVVSRGTIAAFSVESVRLAADSPRRAPP
jgi:hypothetical protein